MQKISVPSVKALTAVPSEEDELHLGKIAEILWRAKGMMAICMLVALTLCAVYLSQLATPLYTSSAVVALQSRNEQIVDFESVVSGLSGDQATINTEVEVLKARGLISKLVATLDLHLDPEFNENLRATPALSMAGLRNAIFGAPPPPSERVVRDKTIDAVLDALSITNVRQSYVFRISVRTTDPEKSARIADALSKLYIRDQLDVKFAATEQATEWLTTQVASLKSDLERTENELKAFRTQTNLVSAEALELQNRQLKDFRERHGDALVQRDLQSARVFALDAARKSDDPAAMLDAAQDDALGRMFNQLATGGAAARQSFDARYEQILERVHFEQVRADAQFRALGESIHTLEAQVEAQSDELLELEQREREANANRLIYEYFLSRLKETSVQQGIQQADSRVLSAAVLPETPSSPKSLVLLAVSAMGGLMLGAGLAVRRELRAKVYRTAEELEVESGLVVIGQVPKLNQSKRKRVLEYIVSKPASAFVESVRNLRTSILLSSADREPRLIMLTSTIPGEGKTTQTLALARSLATMGRKVLVIEGDIRRCTFREYFNAEVKGGLVAAVVEGRPLEEIVHVDKTLGFDVLMGEKASMNAADFFSSRKFTDFLDRARKTYEFILIDTPPVLAVPDARVIGQTVDAVVYVVRWDQTPRPLVRQGLHAFSTVNVPIAGLVLSQIDQKGMKRYGHAEGYGTYASGYYDN